MGSILAGLGRRRRRVPAIVAGLVALTASAALAAPASAVIFEKGSYREDVTEADEVCGIDVVRHTVERGIFRTRAGTGKRATAFFGHTAYHYVDTFTNPETGGSFSISGNGAFTETRAEPVGGTVFRFSDVEAGQPFVLRDASGRVLLRDAGSIRTTYLFDTLGDAVPGGELIMVERERVSGPHPGFELTDEEFCAIVEPLLLG
jgi:hypothetical protein